MRKKQKPSTVNIAATFEELEEIIRQLESGDLPLEEALTLFERGVILANQSQKQLKDAEQRVKILLSDSPDGELAPFSTELS